MNNSYFKVKGQFFFFDDKDKDDTQRAFDLARAVSESEVVVHRPPRYAGPWDRISIIGHRPRREILRDISRTADPDNLFWLKDELAALDRAYFEAGRDTIPLSAVAA